MSTHVRGLTLALIAVAAAAAAASGQVAAPPPWAYGCTAVGTEPAAPPCTTESKPLDCARIGAPRPKDVIHKLPDTHRTFTEYEIHYDYGPADWYPDDHPPMPEIVARGRESDKLRACALCHYPNGQGKPENAPVAGLPAQYILQQLQLFRDGKRRSADPRKANANEMIQIARYMTDEEMKAAAQYFSSITWRPWIKVVETDTVPKAKPGMNGLFLPQPGTDTEPLGQRILEVPEHPDLTERARAPRSGMIAYVPVGSVARGEELVAKGGGRTVQCTLCHGADLQGAGAAPPIADRQASYIVRQLYDMQAGTRESPMMKAVVAKLTDDDMIAIAAYLASK
ncbi:MAG: c-type cytochrome [Acidobacteria bacterium]|nr:c-type cytochrome [Acidobacteriota bacterium]